MNHKIFTLYTQNYKEYIDGLRSSFPSINAIQVESFSYIDKVRALLKTVESGESATWVDADCEIHGPIDSFLAPPGHIYVGMGYDTYFISVGASEKTALFLRKWLAQFTRTSYDADALYPLRREVTPLFTAAFICHHRANVKEGRLGSDKRARQHQVPAEVTARRTEACKACPSYRPESDKCGTCGCSSTMTEASKSPWRICPEGKWPSNKNIIDITTEEPQKALSASENAIQKDDASAS